MINRSSLKWQDVEIHLYIEGTWEKLFCDSLNQAPKVISDYITFSSFEHPSLKEVYFLVEHRGFIVQGVAVIVGHKVDVSIEGYNLAVKFIVKDEEFNKYFALLVMENKKDLWREDES